MTRASKAAECMIRLITSSAIKRDMKKQMMEKRMLVVCFPVSLVPLGEGDIR